MIAWYNNEFLELRARSMTVLKGPLLLLDLMEVVPVEAAADELLPLPELLPLLLLLPPELLPLLPLPPLDDPLLDPPPEDEEDEDDPPLPPEGLAGGGARK